MVTLFQLGCLPSDPSYKKKKTSKHLGSKRWPLSAFARIISFPCQRKQLSGNLLRTWYWGPRAILSPKAPSTIVSLWSRDLRVNNGKNCLVMVLGTYDRFTEFLCVCGCSLPSTWLVPETWLILLIFRNIFKTIEEAEIQKMMLQKTFVKKRSRKIKSDVVFRIIFRKKSSYPRYIYKKQQLKEVSIAPAISAQRLLKFSHCTCRVHIGQDRETWLLVISHRESWWGWAAWMGFQHLLPTSGIFLSQRHFRWFVSKWSQEVNDGFCPFQNQKSSRWCVLH